MTDLERAFADFDRVTEAFGGGRQYKRDQNGRFAGGFGSRSALTAGGKKKTLKRLAKGVALTALASPGAGGALGMLAGYSRAKAKGPGGYKKAKRRSGTAARVGAKIAGSALAGMAVGALTRNAKLGGMTSAALSSYQSGQGIARRHMEKKSAVPFPSLRRKKSRKG